MARGKTPSEFTVKVLCAKTAGHCEFPNCSEKFFFDNISARKFNDAYVAHIVASSPAGPRGDPKRSHSLSDSIDNLMLMCAKHHKLIDDNPNDYPESRLLEIKHNFESKIETICDVLNKPESEMILFTSPLKQNASVLINYEEAAKAVVKNNPIASKYGIPVSISSRHLYSSSEYWEDCEQQLSNWYNVTYKSLLIQRPDIHISVFPIAPIPLIIKLGFLLSDKHTIEIYQHFRNPDTWSWIDNRITNSFSFKEEKINSKIEKIAIIISLSSDISKERITSQQSYDVIFTLESKIKNINCIQSKQDLGEFCKVYLSLLDYIKNTYNKEIDIYPAIPVSAAFEIGRRYMHSVYPKITIYDEFNGFCRTLTIGN